MSLLASLAVAPGTSSSQNTVKWRTIFRAIPSRNIREESEEFPPLASQAENLSQSSQRSDSTDVASSLDGENQPLKAQSDVKEVQQLEKDLIYMKLKALALKGDINSKHQAAAEGTAVINGMLSEEKYYQKEHEMSGVNNPSVIEDISSKDKGHRGEPLDAGDNCAQTPGSSSEYQSLISRVDCYPTWRVMYIWFYYKHSHILVYICS